LENEAPKALWVKLGTMFLTLLWRIAAQQLVKFARIHAGPRCSAEGGVQFVVPPTIGGKWTTVLLQNQKPRREVPETHVPLALLRSSASLDSDSERTHGPCNSPTSLY